ncbi:MULTISPECIES: hypothetical protein [unclassified Streptomyces]|uniref:hypothetical protein n=1 Tax=unclassified Streptomyces TaxID=2593676 RepID=UPI0033C161A8
MTPAVPLALLGLVDAAFSGFRAYAGRDARIRKHRPTGRAALRGLAVGAVLLLAPALTAGLLLLAAPDAARTYDALTAGGIGYLLPLTAYATAVVLSLAAYFVLPFRVSTLAMVVGLGPLTSFARSPSPPRAWVPWSTAAEGPRCWSARSRARPC